jgi:MFS family permease
MTRIWPVPDEGLGNSWYVAEVAEGLALVADPGRDPRPYLEVAARHGLRIGFTAGTHVHADYPALIAAVADTQPSWRARGLAACRFWRDLGYAIGAVIAGLVAQAMACAPPSPPAARSRSPLGLLAASWITGKPGGCGHSPVTPAGVKAVRRA